MFFLKKRKLIRGAFEHLKAGLGEAADYVADGDELILPFDGHITTYHGVEGGNWLQLERPNGDVIKWAHLDHYKAIGGMNGKAGQVVAITGNTGSITTGPHIHVEVYVNGKRVDPVKYFMIKFKISIIGRCAGVYDAVAYADAKLQAFSGGALGLEVVKQVEMPLQAPEKMILTDEVIKQAIVQSGLVLSEQQCIVVSYDHGMTRPWYSTQYIAGTFQVPIMKAPYQITGDTMLFELGHALNEYYNENRDAGLPSISNVDNYDGGEQIVIDKVKGLMPYLSVFEKMPTLGEEIMYELVRHPVKFDEVYALKNGVVRHIANRQTLILGSQDPDKQWEFVEGQTNIRQADQNEWGGYTVASEIHYDPKD